MSGGHWNYADERLKSEMFGWRDEPRNVLEDRELSELTWDLLNLLHDFDYYTCSDTSRETYLKSKTEFKKKWFSNRGIRIRKTIDDAIEECKAELYETYGLEYTHNYTHTHEEERVCT